MKKVTYIEGWGKHLNLKDYRNDNYANQLTVKDVLCPVVKVEVKRHKRKKSTIQDKIWQDENKRKKNLIN